MFLFSAGGGVFLMNKIIKFDFKSWPMPLSGKIVMYICPKCKYKIEVPVEAAEEWEEEDMWNGKDKSIPPYGVCTNCNYNKTVPIDYIGTRGYHYIYKEK